MDQQIFTVSTHHSAMRGWDAQSRHTSLAQAQETVGVVARNYVASNPGAKIITETPGYVRIIIASRVAWLGPSTFEIRAA